MKEHPKEQAQTQWLNRSQPFSIDTHPNLRQATFQRIQIWTIPISNQLSSRGTEWQEQLFRLFRLALQKLEGLRAEP